MTKILGLDLGTNSIGWAVVDDDKNKIAGMGSRIFPEGVDNLGDGEKELSKSASRTGARGVRRQFFRRRLRKRYLIKELAKNKLCPVDPAEVKIREGENVFSNPVIIEWFKLNPYELRARAIKEKITLEELGRIFYHMIQRRGFQSNSRSAGSDNDEKSVIFKGDAAKGKTGITDTQEKIKDHHTLGSYLNELYPEEQQPFINGLERIRNRYTTRQMYIDEFEQIWESQKQHHVELNDRLKTIIGGRKKDGYEGDGVLFHQRPLRSQKHLVGYCSLEPTKTRCPISAIPYELFRIYQWVNTVECNGEKIDSKDRQLIIAQLSSKGKVTFKALKKAINKADAAYQFNYSDDDKVIGTHTISNLSGKKLFGKKWHEFSDKEQEDIWHILYFYEDRDKLQEYASENWGFKKEEQLVALGKFNIKQGYANLSRKAINNILPFLKLGFTYDLSVVLGGVKNAFGTTRWNDLDEPERKLILDNIEDIVRQGRKGGFMEGLKSFLISEFDLSRKELDKLYHHSANIGNKTQLEKLPVGTEADKEIQAIRNPVVITALFEVRKLINEIIDEHGKPDKIRIELARDLKNSKTRRDKIRRDQKRLEKENDRIKAELDYINQRHTHNNLLKFKLWEECNKICPYTGKTISVSQLFSGEVQIEHIMPFSKSLNDSFMNKTLCFADENRAKGDKTPYEFYNEQGGDKWEQIKSQALNCFKDKKNYPHSYAKFKQFVKTKYDEDFISRQLNDTRYISKATKEYLTKLVDEKCIETPPGQSTANIRHKWGLNSVLNEDNAKTRDDHRHHAVDALAVACIKVRHLQELGKWNKYDRAYELEDFPMPWDTFLADAQKSVNQILVSHKKTSSLLTTRMVKTTKEGVKYINKGVSVRGQLHKETVYGKRQAPDSDEAYHVRKPIKKLTTIKHVEKVVDVTIRKLIMEKIESLGGFVNGKTIPTDAFFKADDDGNMKCQIFLPNKNGEPVPVKKVRMKENFSGAEKLKEINQYVNPGNNHHVLIYTNEKGELKEDAVTFWTAVERKKQKQPVFQLPETDKKGEIIATLQINDMFLLGLKEDEIDWENPDYENIINYLYRVQKVSSKDYVFRLVSESSLDNNEPPFQNRIQSFGEGKAGWKTFNPVKVKITLTGKLIRDSGSNPS